jgi:hypothetical protein
MRGQVTCYGGWVEDGRQKVALVQGGRARPVVLQRVHPRHPVAWGEGQRALENLAFSILRADIEQRQGRHDAAASRIALGAYPDFAAQFLVGIPWEEPWLVTVAEMRLWLRFWSLLHSSASA